MKLNILYKDDKVILADKPAGIPVHATPDPNRINFTDQIQKFFNLNYIRTANRLDLETSGIVVFGLDPNYNTELDQILKESRKFYRLVVDGIFTYKFIRTESFLKDGKGRVKTVRSGGKKAITEFKLLHSDLVHKISYLEAELITGRRHQIRIHIAEMGYPILGDKIYGNETSRIKAKRCLLHSYKIELKPVYIDGSILTIQSNLPTEFIY